MFYFHARNSISLLLASILTAMGLVSCQLIKPKPSTHAEAESQSPDAAYRKLIMELVSPFPSNVPGLAIPGGNFVLRFPDNGSFLVRSMSPRSETHLSEMAAIGVTDVIILKKDQWGEVAKERALLVEKFGFKQEHFFQTDLPWKNLPNFISPCEQTIRALQFLNQSLLRGGKVLLHCTVGEDRTGYFSGLLRQLHEGWSAEKAFSEEMCARGYASGNPQKPMDVVEDVNKALTPLYLHMSRFIREKRVTKDFLDVRICQELANAPNLSALVENYRCSASPAYSPQPKFENVFFE
jgi:hypothetical protein